MSNHLLLNQSGAVALVSAALSLLVFPTSSANAETGAETRGSGVSHALGVSATASNFDAGGGLGYRLRLAGGTQFGLDARWVAARKAFVDGYEAKDGQAIYGTASVHRPVLLRGPLELALRFATGVRSLDVDDSSLPEDRSLAVTTELGPIANIALSERVTLRTGWLLINNFQVDPAFDVDAQGTAVLGGLAVAINDTLQAHADVDAGGYYGYDGDGGKFVVRGLVGLRWVGGGGPRKWRAF